MTPTRSPRGSLGPKEERALARLGDPGRVQDFLDSIPYSAEPIYRCPRRVLADRVAHCFDGALLAAAAFRFHGRRPLLLDLRADNDDDHVLAVYRRGAFFGAVAKSNFVGLRFREPIYRSLRELALSYFEVYFNTIGEKSLRSYSALVDLEAFDGLDWMTSDGGLGAVAGRLDSARHYPLLADADVRALRRVDELSIRSGMLGSNPAGLFAPT